MECSPWTPPPGHRLSATAFGLSPDIAIPPSTSTTGSSAFAAPASSAYGLLRHAARSGEFGELACRFMAEKQGRLDFLLQESKCEGGVGKVESDPDFQSVTIPRGVRSIAARRVSRS